MLTKVTIRNFKLFDDVDIELSDRVVFIGPNNSGKTSALQALALWEIGINRWSEKRRGAGEVPRKRPGVTINRRDLIAVPVPQANLLWRNLHVREPIAGKGTQNVRIDVVVEGITGGENWRCGLEFDYANEESFYCRPLRLNEGKDPDRLPIPERVADVRMAYLPPMSGLAANETRLDPGAINVRLGEGRTAEVLRNLCHGVLNGEAGEENWRYITSTIESLFGVELDEPRYIPERGEISMTYTTGRAHLDLSSAGRGLQQTLLLLAHMMANPGSILLLDEPDAHLEILRQRQIYNLLTDTAKVHGNQLIAASHSEVILNEAADRDTVVAFVGKPHRIDDRGSQVLKSLKEIGFDHYYQAEAAGWVLYLEGSTDLAILRAFAQRLAHPAKELLERPFIHYVLNRPRKAQEHFYGLREARKELVGVAIYDRLDQEPPDDPHLIQLCWERREIENYLCTKEVLLAWAKAGARTQAAGPLFERQWPDTMDETIAEIEDANKSLRKPSPWDPDAKVTDDFLDPVFSTFFDKLNLPNLMRKTDYHELAGFVAPGELDREVSTKLDAIVEIAARARPGQD